MVKAAKKATHTVLRDRDVTDQELITVFAVVESLLNFRPLTYQSSDLPGSVPLTHNHFLHGQMGGQFGLTPLLFVHVSDGERFKTLFQKCGEDGSKNVLLC